MAVIVVVGAQFGGEGKGKIVAHLCSTGRVNYVIRCGGPNSGHTVYRDGKLFRLRLLPAGFINPNTKLLLAPGALVDLKILLNEIKTCNVDPNRVKIDRNTLILDEIYRENEESLKLRERVGSTLSGTGMGVAKRALRMADVKLAKDVDSLKKFLIDVSEELNKAVDEGKNVIIEGTQGFGLSLYHTPHYPYATSRDTTASGFLSEVGISPRLVDHVIMCVRTFPIRVEGNSGPLRYEITWQDLQRISGYPYPIAEYTTSTNRSRRIAMFDLSIVKKATLINRPTFIALHGADYLDYSNKGIKNFDSLSPKAVRFIRWLEDELKVPVIFIGTGPTDEEIIDRGFWFKALKREKEIISGVHIP